MMVSICSTVFTLPHRLAATTRFCAAASMRTPDTANSRARMTARTTGLQALMVIMYKKAVVVSSLSARGSANFPKSVTMFHLRAR